MILLILMAYLFFVVFNDNYIKNIVPFTLFIGVILVAIEKDWGIETKDLGYELIGAALTILIFNP